MKKILLTLATCLCLTQYANAQPLSHSISAEPYGGLAFYMAGHGYHTMMGANAGVMIGYSHFWPDEGIVRLGFKTGLDLGYSIGGIHARMNEHFSNVDYLGFQMDYTITGNVKQQINTMRLAIPVMLSMDIRGLQLNVGIKPTFPLLAKGKQDINDLHISALYKEFGVEVTDELVTGLAAEADLHQQLSHINPIFSLWWTIEAGYTWRMSDRHAVSVLAYANLFPQQILGSAKDMHIVDVTPIQDPEYPVADVSIATMTQLRMDAVCYIDFGIKLSYSFSFGKE